MLSSLTAGQGGAGSIRGIAQVRIAFGCGVIIMENNMDITTAQYVLT